MSIVFEYEEACGWFRIVVAGKVDLAEYRAVLDRMSDASLYPEGTPAIWDLRGFELSEFDTALVHQVKNVFSENGSRKGARIAFVVSSELGFGMFRMVQSILGIQENSLVCYDLREAEEWIETGRA
ncbi:MAG: hypothetical protein H6686_06310 [Fibrobacteria bacterium]|nr:hypothetical protein [Fibrobacteria bacterium]